MNRINPIHIVALLTVILIFSLYTLQGSKQEMEENKASYKTTQAIAHKLVSLKNVYANQTKNKLSLQRMLTDSSFQSAGVVTKFKKASVSIKANSIDLRTLNLLLGKLLNTAYVIESMKLTRVNESKADLHMEIRW